MKNNTNKGDLGVAMRKAYDLGHKVISDGKLIGCGVCGKGDTELRNGEPCNSPKTEDWRERFNQTFINFYDEEEDEVDVRSRLTHFIAKEVEKVRAETAELVATDAKAVGWQEGREVGYKEGKLEALRLVEEETSQRLACEHSETGLCIREDCVDGAINFRLIEISALISDLKKKV